MWGRGKQRKKFTLVTLLYTYFLPTRALPFFSFLYFLTNISLFVCLSTFPPHTHTPYPLFLSLSLSYFLSLSRPPPPPSPPPTHTLFIPHFSLVMRSRATSIQVFSRNEAVQQSNLKTFPSDISDSNRGYEHVEQTRTSTSQWHTRPNLLNKAGTVISLIATNICCAKNSPVSKTLPCVGRLDQ